MTKSDNTGRRLLLLFGVVLIAFSLFSAYFLFLRPSSAGYLFRHREASFYIISSVLLGAHAFALLTGIGVIWRKKWGYYLLKWFLYMLFLGFPIGTIISFGMLSYMRRHQTKAQFGFSISPPSPESISTPFYVKMVVLLFGIGALGLFLWMMIAF